MNIELSTKSGRFLVNFQVKNGRWILYFGIIIKEIPRTFTLGGRFG